jgi:hypothetical protein
MLYRIRVRGSVDPVALRDFIDVQVTEDQGETVLMCRVPDTAALSGVVVLLHDLGLRVNELRSIPDVQTF